jgi:alpha-tubulin suppressor-like RCC1 family protein
LATSSSWETYSLQVKTDGTLWMWDGNNLGQLGDNTTVHKSSPVQTVSAGTNWKQVSCAYSNCAAIKTDGTLWTWGSNGAGQLGDNTGDPIGGTANKSSPVQPIARGTNWKYVVAGALMAAIRMMVPYGLGEPIHVWRIGETIL